MFDESGGSRAPEAGWYPDPAGLYELRYFDGAMWTEHVSTSGRQSVSPLGAPPSHGGAASPMAPQWSSSTTGPTGGPVRTDLVGAVRIGFARFADFSGRASRSEYWWWVVASFLAYMAAGVLGAMVGSMNAIDAFTGLTALVLLLPSLAVAVRRLHDTGRSGWWLLLGFIPLVGLVLIVFMASEGARTPNRYGPPLA